MIRPVYALAVLGISLLSAGLAHSSELPIPYNPVEYKKFGNSYNWTPLTGATPSAGSVSFPGRSTISTVEPKINTYQQLPFDKRVNVPDTSKIKITSPITKVSFGKAFVKGAKIMTPIGAIVTVAELANYLKDIGLDEVTNTEDGLSAKIEGQTDEIEVSDGYYYYYSSDSGRYSNPRSACVDASKTRDRTFSNGQVLSTVASEYMPRMPNNNYQYAYCYSQAYLDGVRSTTFDFTFNIYRKSDPSCPVGWYIDGGKCTKEIPARYLTEQEILDRIASSSGWPSSAAGAAKSLLNRGVSIETGTPIVSGPSSIPGSSTTTTQSVNLVPGTNTPAAPGSTNTEPGTMTTNTTTTNNVTYNNNTATTSSTTNTVTNITNNVTNITITDIKTETKENKESDEKEEDTPNDTPLGDIPDLYEQKYPDGIAGVLNTKFDELKASPLFSLPSMIMPSLPSTGSCPSWQLDFSLSSWAPLGVHTVEAPCWVWDFGKVVVIISALLLARRLIFGG